MPLTPSQQAAVESAQEPLFIQAGAGTGKTFTLTKRIAYGLSQESGPLIGDVDRLLTITFTNKAAGELIGRVRAELRAQGLDEESLKIDAAWISTIHSMCRRILLSHAFDVGVDPGANLLSEDETQALSALALDALLQDNAKDARLILLFDNLGVESATKLINSLSELLMLAPGGRDDFDLGPAPASARTIASRVQGLLATYQGALAELDELGLPEGKITYVQNRDKVAAVAASLEALLASQKGTPSWSALANAIEECKPPGGGNLSAPYNGIFAECRDALLEVAAEAQSASAYELLRAALDLAAEHLERHRALKQAQGAFDTNDLLIATYKLLDEDDELARTYRESFDSVMVDEFQDTDNLQVGIVSKICDEDLATLATVGDAQQSIYGFRGADLEVYQRTRAMMRERGSNEVELTVNYRSQPDILRFVEDIFSKPEFFGGEFLKVSSGRGEGFNPSWLLPDEPRVKILLSAGHKAEKGQGRTSVDALRQADAVALADEFERLHAQGAPYGDMAILLQSTKGAKAGSYLRELRKRGIPVIVSGGSDFFLQPEVSTVVMLLRVLADRDDDEALFDLLGSDFFNASDDALLVLSVINRQHLRLLPGESRAKPSLYDALCLYVEEAQEDADEALARAFDTLEYALAASPSIPLAQLVREAIALSGWQATLSARGIEGGAVFANIERACDLIEDYEKLHGHAPFATSAYFRSLVDLAREGKGARAKLGTLVSSGQDAVCIMTIHSSKGLEFPIVAVAEFEKSTRHTGASLISLSEEGRRYLALGVTGSSAAARYLADEDQDPGSFAFASEVAEHRAHAHQLKKLRDAQEQQRLLYVALTRARDKLILVAHDGAFASKGDLSAGLTSSCLHAVFGKEIPMQHAKVRTDAGALVELAITEVPYGVQEEQADDKENSLVVTHRYPVFELPPRISAQPLDRRQIYSYSSIAHRDAQHRELVAPAVALHDRSQDVETVSPVGSSFHLVAQWLASVPRADERGIERRMLAAAHRYGLDEEQRTRLANAVAAWVSSERYAMVQEHECRHAEYAFCVDVEGVPLEGYIDLICFDGEGGALVIDYKTGTSGQGEDLHERYALQAQCYAYALLSSGACEHVDMAFVRPEANMEEVTFSFDAIDAPTLAQRILGA